MKRTFVHCNLIYRMEHAFSVPRFYDEAGLKKPRWLIPDQIFPSTLPGLGNGLAQMDDDKILCLYTFSFGRDCKVCKVRYCDAPIRT